MTWFDVAGGVNAHGDGSISVGVVCTTIGNKSFAGQIEDAPVVGPVAVAVEVVPADTTPPTITITNTPPDIQTWRDTAVNVKIDATDDKALSKVEYWWDTELHTVETATGVSWTKTIQSPLSKKAGGHTLLVIATDAAGNSSPGSATPYKFNRCPVPVDINWNVYQNSTNNFLNLEEKASSDGDGDSITFSITDPPDHAQLGTGGLNINSFSYTPTAGYIGTDSFTFATSDAICPAYQTPVKATGIVNITVLDVNEPPTCTPKTVSTPQNTAIGITLPGTDPDGDALTWTATADSGTYHGTVGTVTGNNITYTPGTNDTRTVTFAYTVTDTGGLSCRQGVTVNISANNRPGAVGQTVNVTEDTQTTITLNATDADSNELTICNTSSPLYGSLGVCTQAAHVGTNDSATIIYTPKADYAEGDLPFKFKANDTIADSNEATIILHFIPVNDPPKCFDSSIIAQEDVPYNGIGATALQATDVDSATLTFSKVSDSSKGIVTVNGIGTFQYTYTYDTTTPQTDSFQYRVYDGSAYSPNCTVNVSGNPVNDKPSLPTATINSNTTPPKVSSILTCSATPTTPADPDGPTPVMYQYSFEKNISGSWVSLRGWSTASTYTCATPDCAKNLQVRCAARGVDNNGAGLAGDPGYSSSVTIANSPPTGPTLTSPPNTFPNAGTTVSHSWLPATDPDNDPITYKFYRCQGAGCSMGTMIGTTADSSFTSSSLVLGITYQWRVSASDGVVDTASATWSFVTAVSADFIVTLAPQSGALTTVPKNTAVPFIATVEAKNGWTNPVTLSFVSGGGSPAPELAFAVPTCTSYPGGKCEVNFNVKSPAFGTPTFYITGAFGATTRTSNNGSFNVWPKFTPTCSPANAAITTDISGGLQIYPPGFLLTPSSTLTYKVKPNDGYYVYAWGPSPVGFPTDSCAGGVGGTDLIQTGAEKSCILTMSDDRVACPIVKAKEGVSLILDPKIIEAPVTTTGGGAGSACQSKDGMTTITVTAKGEGAFTGSVDFSLEGISSFISSGFSGPTRCTIATKGGTCTTTIVAWVPTAVDHTFTVRAQNTARGINTTATGTVQGRWQITTIANPADGNSDGIIDNTVTPIPTKSFYTQAEAVTVRANPGGGYAVAQFTGACTGSGTAITGSSAKTCPLSMTCHQKVGVDFIRDSGANFSVSLRSPTKPYTTIGGSISGFTVDVTKIGGFSGDVNVQGDVSNLLVTDGTSGSGFIGVKFPDTPSKVCSGTANCSYPTIVYDARAGGIAQMSGTVKVAGTSGTKREESITQVVGFLPVVTVAVNPVAGGDIMDVSKLAGQIIQTVGSNGYMVVAPTVLNILVQPRAGYRMADTRYSASPGVCDIAPITGTKGYSCVYKNPATTYPIDRNGTVTAQFSVDTASISVSIARDTTRTQKVETDSNVIIPIGGIAYYTVTVKKDPSVAENVNLSVVPVSGPGTPGITGSLSCSAGEFDANGECKKTLIVNGNDSGDVQTKVQATTASGAPGPQPIQSNTVITHVYETLTLTRDGVDGCTISQGATQLLSATETSRWHLVPRGNITLTSAASGAVFGGWKEGCTGASTDCTIPIPPSRSAKIQCNSTSTANFVIQVTPSSVTIPRGGVATYTVRVVRAGGSTFSGAVNLSFSEYSRLYGGPTGSDPTYSVSWDPAPSCMMNSGSNECSTTVKVISINGFGGRYFNIDGSAPGFTYTCDGTGCSSYGYFDIRPKLTLQVNDPSRGYPTGSPYSPETLQSYGTALSIYSSNFSAFVGSQQTGWACPGTVIGSSPWWYCQVSMDNDKTVIANFDPLTVEDYCIKYPNAVCNDPNNGSYYISGGFNRCLIIPYNSTTSATPSYNTPLRSYLDPRPSHNYSWNTFASPTSCDNRSCLYERSWFTGASSTTPYSNVYEYFPNGTCTFEQGQRTEWSGGVLVTNPYTSCNDYPSVLCSTNYADFPYESSIVSGTCSDQTYSLPVGYTTTAGEYKTLQRTCQCNLYRSMGINSVNVPSSCTQDHLGNYYSAMTFRCEAFPAFSLNAMVSYQDSSPFATVNLSLTRQSNGTAMAFPSPGGCVVSATLQRQIDGGAWTTIASSASDGVGALYQEKRVKYKLRACSSSGCAEAESNELTINNPPLCPTVFSTTPVSSSSNPLSPHTSAAVEFSYPSAGVIDPVIDPDGASVTYQIKLVDPAGVAKNLTCASVGSKKFSCSVNPSKYTDLKYRNSSGTGPYHIYVDPADRTGRTRSSVSMSECNVGDIYTKIVADPTITLKAQKPGTIEVKDIAFFGDNDSVDYVLNYSFASGTGIDNAIDTKIYIDLPVPASNVSSVLGGSPSLSGNRMTLALGNVAPGASGEVRFTLYIPSISTDASTLSTQASLMFDADCVSGGASCALRVASASVALYRRTGAYFTTTGGSIYSKSNIINLDDPNATRKPVGLYYIISDGQVANIPVDPRARVRQYAGQQFGVPTDTSSLTKLGKLPIDDMINNVGGKYDVTTVACGSAASDEGVNCSASELFLSAGMTVSSTADSDAVTLNSAKGKVILVPEGLNVVVRKHLKLDNAPVSRSGAVSVIIRRGNMDIYNDITYTGTQIDAEPKRVASGAWIIKQGNAVVYAEQTAWNNTVDPCPGYKGGRWCAWPSTLNPDGWPEIAYLIQSKGRTITAGPTVVSGLFYVAGTGTNGIFFTGKPQGAGALSDVPLKIQGAVVARDVQFQRKKFPFD
ncbi:MAG: hypothetical protein A3C07_02965 [Candidatus Sungbacteria bacterium RIFCSPHIGHO2_02_FULL_47_11]|uniref:Fibronectin type-III domain-containing protein n=1 Tax=Candidatus Sungbacteria bacterium RIFCSPHIGHO2_02_FULL_47_11 TaxID=1802270 RepID=A0A1G2KK35_9BACT|nr:MAG: hypothetical protein A3C07_02965 [Candidatus Sungbacteria bacterium RIFCSPHIGHO2_02_FULL_47_11]